MPRFRMPRLSRSTWVWLGLMLLCALGWGYYVAQSGRYTQNRFIYALDDPYIHMGIARNLAEHGVWGTSPDGFSSASSSIIWPISLAALYLVIGPVWWGPYALNIAGLLLGAVMTARILKREFPDLWGLPFGQALFFVAPAMAAPVTSLLLGGLEHIWHWVGVTIAVDFAALALQGFHQPGGKRRPLSPAAKTALLWAPALTVIRFESMALVPLICAWALWQRRWLFSILYGISAMWPMLLFGCISLAKGAMFFPNSLVIKATPGGSGLLGKIGIAASRIVGSLSKHTGLLGLIIAAILLWYLLRKSRGHKVAGITLLCFVYMALAHSAFASFGWLYRYEAYLLAWGSFSCLLGLLCLAYDHKTALATWWQSREKIAGLRALAQSSRATAIILAILLGTMGYTTYTLTRRADRAARVALGATRNIYEQQYQFARFLDRYYKGSAVAFNDIGAASFFPGIKVVDLYGLGNNEVARLKYERRYTQADLARIAKDNDVRIAIVYDKWFRRMGGMPPEWTRVGRWEIRNNRICGDSVISFYGVNDIESENLRSHLRSFASALPKRVKVLPP